MLVAERYVGNRADPDVDDRVRDAETERVVLTDTERRRSRIRTETTEGREIGVVVGRDLADGDVLEADDGRLLVVELADVEALVVSLADASATAALELGHALGNRHRDLAVREGEAVVPLADARERLESAVDEFLPEAPRRVETVPPTTFDGTASSHGAHAHHGDHSHGTAHARGDGTVRSVDPDKS